MTLKFQIKPYTKVPQRLVSKPRLTVEDMFKKSTKNSRDKAKKVRILSMQKMRTPKILKDWFTYRLMTQNMENGHRYKITIFSPTLLIKPKTKVIIDSPNANFVYRYEYALAKRGNAFIYRSNGDAPSTTNPRMTPGLDHHTIASLKYLVKATRRTALIAKKKEDAKKKKAAARGEDE